MKTRTVTIVFFSICFLMFAYSMTSVFFKKKPVIPQGFEWYDQIAVYHESDDLIYVSKDCEIYLEQTSPIYNVIHYYKYEEEKVVMLYRDTIWAKDR